MTPKVKRPPSHIQPTLFELPTPKLRLTGVGSSRTRYGQVVEEIITHGMGLTPINTGGSSPVIYDAHKDETFYEIKSLRRTSSLPIYEWRREKDRTCGVPLLYAIGIHNVTRAMDMEEIWHGMSRTLKKVLLVPAPVIDALAEEEPLRQLKSEKKSPRSGYHWEGYKDGYRNVPAKRIVEAAPHFITRIHTSLHGVNFDFELFGKLADAPTLVK